MTTRDDWNAKIRRAAYALEMERVQDWSEQITEYRDAVVLPQTIMSMASETDLFSPGLPLRRVYDGGVYTADGKIVPEAIHVSGSHRHVPAAWLGAPEQLERLPGRWLYAGILRGHFGHFMVECLGRLWGLAEAGGPFDGILYVNLNGVPRQARAFTPTASAELSDALFSKRKYLGALLKIFAGNIPVKVVGMNVQVEKLVVPSQMMGNIGRGDFIGGHATFRRYVKTKISHFGGNVGRRIYVSRSRLPTGSSSFFLERVFERKLESAGYEILHPQELSIEEQLRAYASASKIIAATGSAVHLMAFATHSEQDVAILGREFAAPKKFATQMKLMGARNVAFIQEVQARLRPENPADETKISWNVTNAIHILDFDNVWERLREGGFVDTTANFKPQFDELYHLELNRISQATQNISFTTDVPRRELSEGAGNRRIERIRVATKQPGRHARQVDGPPQLPGHLEHFR